jgi:hypothetical protein
MDNSDDRQTEEFLAHLLKQGTDDYLSRGRRFQTTELPVLADLWIGAFRDVFMNDRADRIPDMDDLTVELGLRHVDPPAAKVAAEIARIFEEDRDSVSPQILQAIENFLAERTKSTVAVWKRE